MITNKSITYYQKAYDSNKLEIWKRKVFKNVWSFNRKNSNVNAGYENANNIDVRIPIKEVKDTNMFKIGDIIAIGIQEDIERQSDLEGIEFYNVISININDFGNNPHIHLGGR